MNEIRFDDLLALLDEYSSSYVSELDTENLLSILAEVKKRIRQTWRLHQLCGDLLIKISNLQQEFESLGSSEGKEIPKIIVDWINLTDSLEMYAESFYLIAWRLRCVIRLLPGMKKFESKGVQMVRNHLIEHPSKDRQAGHWGFALSDDVGPKLVRALPKGEEPIDKGLWVNMLELTTKIRTGFRNAINLHNMDA